MPTPPPQTERDAQDAELDAGAPRNSGGPHDRSAGSPLSELGSFGVTRTPAEVGIGSTATGMSPKHTINNLLQIIQGNSDLARDEEISPDVRAMLDEISDAAADLSELLDRRRWTEDWFSLETDLLDLEELLNDCRLDIEQRLGREIELFSFPPPMLAVVRGSRNQLCYALRTIADLARDALPAGGRLSLGVCAGEHDVNGDGALGAPEVKAARMSLVATLESHDPNCDHPTKERAKHRLKRHLSTCRAVAAFHEGALAVDSGSGCPVVRSLSLSMPVAFPPRDAGTASEPSALAESLGLILLADNDDDLRTLSAQTLRRAGFVVLEARDGHEAESLFRRHCHALDWVILDASMPGRSGASVYETIRAGSDSIPLLFAARLGDPLPSVPAVRILRKPFRQVELLREATRIKARAD